MQYTVRLPKGLMRLYYNENVYSPEYSSVGTILLANRVIKDAPHRNLILCDVGSGSGVVGLGIKFCNPSVQVILSDVDRYACKVAKLNAKRLGLSVKVVQGSMLPEGTFDIVTANMPTYTEKDMVDLHGPDHAYLAGQDPLTLYKELFAQAKDRCIILICECQKKYQEPFLKMAEGEGWTLILSSDMVFAFTHPKN